MTSKAPLKSKSRPTAKAKSSIKHKPHPKSRKKLYVGLGCGFAILLSACLVFRVWYRANNNAAIHKRDTAIADALHNHPVKNVVAESPRLAPLRPSISAKQAVVSLANCPQAVTHLDITKPIPVAFQTDSFAYVLSYDQLVKNAPNCSLSQVIAAYGRPNQSVLIAGTLTQPKELLLLYDRGVHKSSHTSPQSFNGTAIVVPERLMKLPINTACSGKTVLNIVAHQDDDLLFLSPDLLHDIRAEKCVRTIYLTAGDAGRNQYYWLAREHGSERAYSYMTPESDDIWIERIVQLSDTEFVNIATPRNNPNISLIFMHLPDGNPLGGGFKSSKYGSLAKLASGKIQSLSSVDGQSEYTSNQLVSALASLIDYYRPSVIRSQSTQRVLKNNPYPDHSDHITVGSYVKIAYRQAHGITRMPSLYYYTSYPIRHLPGDLSPSDFQEKELTFLKYAKYDSAVCGSIDNCATSPDYGAYLKRQYQAAY